MKRIISIMFSLIIMLNSFVTAYAGEEISDKYFEAAELYASKDYEKCIEVAEELLTMDDSHMEAYYFIAMSAYRSGNYELAYQTLKSQLEKNPNNELALYNSACVASILEKNDECVDLIKRLLTLDITNKSSIKNDSDFDNIRNNDEYKKMMEISVIFGGEWVEFDVAPIVIDGRTLLPVRKVFECLGAEVTYDDVTKTAIAKKDDTEIRITIDEKVAKVNGEDKELDVPAMVLNGRTLVPVRFVGEALNAEVDWDGENEVVYVMMPINNGNMELADVQAVLDEKTAVSVVDGIFPEPYKMNSSEGCTMIIFKENEALKLFSDLSYSDKAEYMKNVAYENFALVIGCSTVYVNVVYDGKVYYSGVYDYVSNEVTDLKYYSKGKIENVVKQYKSSLNYKDFYMLPESEQITSTIGD